MKFFRTIVQLLTVFLLPGCSTSPVQRDESLPMQSSLFDYSATDLSARKVSLDQFRGKVALVVNTASQCGFTYQYKNLEEVYQRFKDRGFVVLGFPSNDFGGQEPGADQEIKKFCELKYHTTFPMFSKAPVSGQEKQEVFRYLTEASADEFKGDPGWNFVKFLVNKEGKVVGRFSSMTSPTSDGVIEAIQQQLAQ